MILFSAITWTKLSKGFLSNTFFHLIQETRLSLRMDLLKVFGALCNLQKELISLLLYSVLPTELAREIVDTLKDGSRSKGKGDSVTLQEI